VPTAGFTLAGEITSKGKWGKLAIALSRVDLTEGKAMVIFRGEEFVNF
jgi:hypothetical protein